MDANGNPLSTLANLDSRRRLYPNVFSRVNQQDSTANASYHSMVERKSMDFENVYADVSASAR